MTSIKEILHTAIEFLKSELRIIFYALLIVCAVLFLILEGDKLLHQLL